jgi:YfiH family protein
MKEIKVEGVSFLQFSNLKKEHWLTRKPFDMHQVNASYNSQKFQKLFELEHQVVFPIQEHTDNICTVNHANINSDFPDCDALITNEKNIPIAVRTADCVPVLLEDSKVGVVAAVHAGWRGTVQNIVGKTIEKMIKDFDCNPKDIFVGIGPSISPSVYEVGEEVYQSFYESNYPNDLFFKQKNQKGKYLLDLWAANMWQIEQNDIPKSNVEISKMCTFTQNKRFYSARRDTINTGRMAAIIKL